jgi:hypothetical protein
MAVGIEDILLMKAAQERQEKMSPQTGAILGAAAVGAGGLAIGDLAQRLNPTIVKGNFGARLQPGRRFAGGLVGAVLGGALGAGVASSQRNYSPAAALLAKVQTQGELSAADQNALQAVLQDIYTNDIGM